MIENAIIHQGIKNFLQYVNQRMILFNSIAPDFMENKKFPKKLSIS
jgi:hypothetical protein